MSSQLSVLNVILLTLPFTILVFTEKLVKYKIYKFPTVHATSWLTMFQDTIKNFSISFDERNTFSAGDFITGTISFDLTKEIKISALTIKIKGGANVQWSTASRSENLRRRNYRARMQFFTYKSAIIQTNTGMRTN